MFQSVTGVTFNTYAKRKDVVHEYCLEVKGPPRRIIDAGGELCDKHPGNRCLGRIANHLTLKEANLIAVEMVLDKVLPKDRVVFMKATRDIEPYEQLSWDYGDKVARDLFDE